MPEFDLDRMGTERPLVSLPAMGRIAPDAGKLQIFVEVGKGSAGCYICSTPIPKGTTRVTFKIRVEKKINGEIVGSRPARFSVHPGCLLKPMGSEIKRGGEDCWDCGADPRSSTAKPGEYWGEAFTTHRFVWARLCPFCQTKPRWQKCGNCGIHYPFHMVFRGELSSESKENNVWVEEATQEEGLWCTHCAERWGVITLEQVRESAEEWEAARRRIMEEGIFDAS